MLLLLRRGDVAAITDVPCKFFTADKRRHTLQTRLSLGVLG
jgi:hypothetical protein